MLFCPFQVILDRDTLSQAVGGNRVDVKKAMDAVTRREAANFITGSTMNQVTRSRYGRRLAQNMTRALRPARTFSTASGKIVAM